MHRVVIADALRTPFGRFGGHLKGLTVVELASLATRSLLARTGIDGEEVDETFFGTAILGGCTSVAARQINYKSGVPLHKPSLTIDRACCSSMTGIRLAAGKVRAEDARVVLAGGGDSCSNTPYLQRGGRFGRKVGDFQIEDPLQVRNPMTGLALAGVTGEVALAHGVDRAQQDEWARRSHHSYFEAYDRGYFKDELIKVSIEAGRRVVDMEIDEAPRRGLSLETLASLPTVYGGPTVTAGNAPGLNDGAAATLVMTAEEARRRLIEPLCELVADVQLAGPLDSSPFLPGVAIGKVVEKAGLKLSDIKRIEINEAFAAMPLVSTVVLSKGDATLLAKLRDVTNVNGGAVALGHPMGASGARITMTLARGLRDAGGGYGVAAVCGGYGQADAILIKVD